MAARPGERKRPGLSFYSLKFNRANPPLNGVEP
jgi:hypothetical protein